MRNAAPFLLPGKTGVARLAHWTGAPVVPFGFDGPSTWTFNQGLRASLAFRRDMFLRIGKPLAFSVVPDEQLTKDLLVATTRQIMTAIGELAGRPSPY
jgi:1-acyl-sn-glycerol-3-phosphate acyltransferase